MENKGPGIYSDLGKKARDLLYKDYQGYYKFNANLRGDFTTEPAPGLKAILSFRYPDRRSSKLELQYEKEYSSNCASIGLLANPIVSFSSMMGTSTMSLGSSVDLDTNTGSLSNFSLGVSFSNEDSVATLTLSDKGDGSRPTLTGTCYHAVKSMTNTFVGAEASYTFLTKKSTFVVGTEHALDPLTTVKYRVNSLGIASSLIQYKWFPSLHFTLSTEADTRAPVESATYGFLVSLGPDRKS